MCCRTGDNDGCNHQELQRNLRVVRLGQSSESTSMARSLVLPRTQFCGAELSRRDAALYGEAHNFISHQPDRESFQRYRRVTTGTPKVQDVRFAKAVRRNSQAKGSTGGILWRAGPVRWAAPTGHHLSGPGQGLRKALVPCVFRFCAPPPFRRCHEHTQTHRPLRLACRSWRPHGQLCRVGAARLL